LSTHMRTYMHILEPLKTVTHVYIYTYTYKHAHIPVWSYGVLIWEVWSACKVPYWNITNDKDIIDFVCGGGRLSEPEGCRQGLYQLMLTCWAQRKMDRYVCIFVCMLQSYDEMQHKLI
jgi:hypothetical protein